jgi:hypothetical protein
MIATVNSIYSLFNLYFNSIAFVEIMNYYSINLNKKATNMKTAQLHPSTATKLKAIAFKRKQDGKNSNKQTEILTELVNKLFDKECK